MTLGELMKYFRPRKLTPRSSIDGRSHIPGVPDELTIEVDPDGSPVTMQPEEWFVCFVPGLQKQWWHRFTDPRHKHVFALRMVSDDRWILFEPWWTRIMNTTLTLDEAAKFLRWGGVGSVLRIKESIPGSGSQTRGWANCAVLVSLLLGRSYWTWTPHGLYQALIREPETEHVDVAGFLEKLLHDIANKQASRVVTDRDIYRQRTLIDALYTVGIRLMRITTSPLGLGLHRLAASEAFHFPTASAAFFEHGPNRVIEELAFIFQRAQSKGEVSDRWDAKKLARHFLLMLRGNLHLEIMMGCRDAPDEVEIERRVLSAVDLLLYGMQEREQSSHPIPRDSAAQ
ncbi:TetR/AcrR family transcriptional regulator C-terminal domain-containing protein [Pseudomonas aeruginosa]|uniref:TetR/AcrR family transcriptional regulator C-terminal domain-containing protein n=1 Tax=Pseudomonas aeruginosa TaxID=287 RepID=UPI0013736EFD